MKKDRTGERVTGMKGDRSSRRLFAIFSGRPEGADREPEPVTAAPGRNQELLRMELTELNTFVRHHFQLYLGWYTFFLTVNFGAIGWFTGVLLTGALKVSLPILFIATFFVIQLIISYVASREVCNYFAASHLRSRELIEMQLDQPPDPRYQPRSPIPLQVYQKIIKLICSTLISFIFFWLALSMVAIYLVPL